MLPTILVMQVVPLPTADIIIFADYSISNLYLQIRLSHFVCFFPIANY